MEYNVNLQTLKPSASHVNKESQWYYNFDGFLHTLDIFSLVYPDFLCIDNVVSRCRLKELPCCAMG